MTKDSLIHKLKRVEKIAAASKIKRMLVHPFKYCHAILFRELSYKRKKREKEVVANTFFDATMHLLLPSSTDIYLTGGKSHDSEIRLAKFLIHHLNLGDTFVDVGAHYGYFTLLGSTLVGDNGSVYSFEASPVTHKVLHKNTVDRANVNGFNLAVSNEIGVLKFYEFPNLFSEYNTLEIDQFQEEDWYAEYKPKEITIKSIVLDSFLSERGLYPKLIKIDVEGAEDKVIEGLSHFLTQNSAYIVMEYLSQERGNTSHQVAAQKLHAWGYTSFSIDSTGTLNKIESVAEYLKNENLDSDNIVFVKEETMSKC